ncbi:cyclin [Mycena sanguinolenta]|nr:cyclin [Mycena sanguinolenta]
MDPPELFEGAVGGRGEWEWFTCWGGGRAQMHRSVTKDVKILFLPAGRKRGLVYQNQGIHRDSLVIAPSIRVSPLSFFLDAVRDDNLCYDLHAHHVLYPASLRAPVTLIVERRGSSHNPSATMKDVSNSALHKHSRTSLVYPKKRPSPHGISKPGKTPLLLPPRPPARKSPRSAKTALVQQQQRQREAQIQALRQQGILLEEEYRDEIRHYMHDMERYTMSSMQSMDQQPEIRWHMRPCLVDFLVEIHFTFRLRPETLYLTLNIVDRYVSRRIVYIKHYQLVGCAALWIAAKFEDAKERVPTVHDLAAICRDTYDESAFIQMEGHVLSTIQWTLGHPTAEAWLRLMCVVGPCVEDAKVQHVARFLMEITLFHREFVRFSPSSIAFAALTLARFLCGRPHRRTWEEPADCMDIVDFLDTRLAKHVDELSETLVKKYSYAFYSKAATFVVQYYLQGGRYERPASLPMTPIRSPASTVSTPMSASTTVSDQSDDFPVTPSTPAFSFSSSDPFGGFSHAFSDKENVAMSFEPVLNKLRIDSPPEQFLPHDFVTSRPALQNLSNVSPRVVMAS